MCLGPSHVSRASRTNNVSRVRSEPMKRSRHSFSSVSTSSTSWSGSVAPRRDSVSGRWVEDAECGACRKCERVFTLMNRRHHCRICGNIFCNSCSRTRMMIATTPGDVPKRQRVCDPCSSHAQTNAILYDIDDDDDDDRISHFSTASSSDFVLDHAKPSELSDAADAGPSISFMLASMVCFAASFWFLKDEVAYTNPAIWILLAGFLKNLYQLLVSLRFGNRRVQQLHADHATHSELKSASHSHLATAPALTSASAQSAMTAAPATKQDENPLGLSEAKMKEMLAAANKSVDQLWDVAMSQDNWTPEPNAFEIDDVVLSSRDGKPARNYKCEAVIDLSPEELFDVLHGQFENSAWNITVAENKVVQTLSDDTDVVHVTSAPALGGMISSRDFINTRTWRKRDGGYIIGSNCAGKNLIKPVKGVTRGENGVTGFVILPHESSAFKCRFIWILNCDIKGYFPGSLIRKGSLSEQCCFVRNLRRHLAATMGSDSNEATP